MNKLRKQSDTAYPLFFFMVDSSDHITGKTGLTPTVTVSKNGAAFGGISGAVTEVGLGLYKIAGNATDSNTVGELWIHATGTGADPTDTSYTIVAYDPFDSVRLGLTALPNVVAAGNGGLPTVNASNQVKASVEAYASGMTPLQPTVAGRTLDVTATGEAGIDWANVGSPTTTVGLSGTTISTTQAVASVAALGATAKSDVNAEVVDALATDTYAEPSGVPSATASLKDKIGWIQAVSRNKITQTATTQTLRNDGDSGTISTSTVSDDGTTFTRNKFA